MILRDDKGELIDCWEAKWDPIRKVFDGYVDESEEGKAAARSWTAKPAREGRFIKHIFPVELIDDIRVRGTFSHFHVVCQLDRLWFKQYRKPEPVTLTEVPVSESKSMSRQLKNRILRDLEAWGWIEVGHAPGRAARVALKWKSER
jgi:hypothetical protein